MSGQGVGEDVMGGLAGAASGFLVGGPVGAVVGAGVGVAGSLIAQNNTPSPNLQAPTALSSTPTLAQTNTTALQTQLAKEAAVAPSSTYLGVTGGLLDTPTTTSRTLMGA